MFRKSMCAALLTAILLAVEAGASVCTEERRKFREANSDLQELNNEKRQLELERDRLENEIRWPGNVVARERLQAKLDGIYIKLGPDSSLSRKIKAAREKLKQARETTRLCMRAAKHSCMICYKKDRVLPSDPCVGKKCYCFKKLTKRKCNCPEREWWTHPDCNRSPDATGPRSGSG